MESFQNYMHNSEFFKFGFSQTCMQISDNSICLYVMNEKLELHAQAPDMFQMSSFKLGREQQ